MSTRPLRRRWTAAVVAVTAVAAAPLAIAAPRTVSPVSSWRSDHVLLAVTGGAGGAHGFATSLTVDLVDPGTGPRASMLSLGDSSKGGATVANEGGGGPVRLSTTGAAGGVSVQLSGSLYTLQRQEVTMRLTIDALLPGQTVAVLEAFGNMRISPVTTPTHTLKSGSVALRVLQGPGTVVVPVGDPHEGGVAADAGPIGAGEQQHDFTPRTGIAGAFLDGITQATVSTWTAPDGKTGSYADVGSQWAGWASFAGPAGHWQVDWAGADATAWGNPAAFLYVPVGSYWRLFRCKTGCLAPVPG